jgi:predicted metal-dependent hydrolase
LPAIIYRVLKDNKIDLDLIGVRLSSRAKRLIYKSSLLKGVEIVVPKNADLSRVAKITEARITWIRNEQRKVIEGRSQLKPDRIEFNALGENWTLKYVPKDNRLFEGDNCSLTLGLNTDDIFYSARKLQNWFQNKARETLIPWITLLAENRGLSFNRVFIKNQTSLWGSCSAKRNINLNRNLLFISPLLVEYVLHHELTHLVYMNHSNKFWRAFCLILPNCKELQEEIRSHKPEDIPLWASPGIKNI